MTDVADPFQPQWTAVPLTFPAHQAFVLPLKRRWPEHFDGVALVVSAGAPDLGYALRELPFNSYSLVGIFGFAVPVTVMYSWILRRWGAPGVMRLIPASSVWSRYGSIRRHRPPWRAVLVSTLVGAGSHVAIDGFTHSGRFASRALGLDTYLFTTNDIDFTISRLMQYAGHSIGSLVGLFLLWRLASARPVSAVGRPTAASLVAAATTAVTGAMATGIWISATDASPIFVFGCGLALTLLASSVAIEMLAGNVRPDKG